MAHRLQLSESTFSPNMLIPLIEKYALEQQRNVGPDTWVPDLFIDVGFPFESIVTVLQQIWFGNVSPFVGAGKRSISAHIVYVLNTWYESCISSNQRIFGGDENAQEVGDLLGLLADGGLDPKERDLVSDLKRKILRSFR